MRIDDYFLGAFEAETDMMSALDARRELLKLVRDERERAQRIRPFFHENNELAADFVSVLLTIERLLDTNNDSFWKLELKQRRRGKRTVGAAASDHICTEYWSFVLAGTPKKAAIGKLAKDFGVTDTAIREVIRRASGKKPKR